MAEYIIRIIAYVCLLLVNVCLYIFFHSHFYFLVLVLMLSAPVVSFLAAWLLRRYMKVDICHTQDSYGRQGETAYFKIQIHNPTWFVSLDTKLLLTVENTLLQTKGTQYFSVPVYARNGYELSIPIAAEYPGMIRIGVSDIYVKDLMGFFRFQKKVDAETELSILPKQVAGLVYEKTALEQGMLESEESTKRGNDFSDVQEIREYIPGDKLMSIHWKLSAKRDNLMVKDRVSMSDHQLVVLPELCVNSAKQLAEVLQISYSVILEFISAQTSVRFLYWSQASFEYVETRIDYKEELDAAFARMYYETGYQNPIEASMHMALVHPEMHAYLHVYADAQGVHMAVRENL